MESTAFNAIRIKFGIFKQVVHVLKGLLMLEEVVKLLFWRANVKKYLTQFGKIKNVFADQGLLKLTYNVFAMEFKTEDCATGVLINPTLNGLALQKFVNVLKATYNTKALALMKKKELQLVKINLQVVQSLLILTQLTKCVFHVHKVVLVVTILTYVKSVDHSFFMSLKQTSVFNFVEMEKSFLLSVMMEITMTTMAAVETVG